MSFHSLGEYLTPLLSHSKESTAGAPWPWVLLASWRCLSPSFCTVPFSGTAAPQEAVRLLFHVNHANPPEVAADISEAAFLHLCQGACSMAQLLLLSSVQEGQAAPSPPVSSGGCCSVRKASTRSGDASDQSLPTSAACCAAGRCRSAGGWL